MAGLGVGAFLTWFGSRNRRPFIKPAVAATMQHALVWVVMMLSFHPQRGFPDLDDLRSFGFWAAEVWLLFAVLPGLGWFFASRGVFAVLALLGIFAWPFWALFVLIWIPGFILHLDALSPTNRVVGSMFVVQITLWPLCFIVVYRCAMGQDRRR
ncbi:hypothetical protein J4558_14650 [Leptolyngbya sp. 15MV]|nr:hypothetical protein J4558_14650 [Leptolyngbya sp. 15MV]